MDDPAPVETVVAGLRNAARQLKDAIKKANQLPDPFPSEYFDEVLHHIEEIDSTDVDSIRVATHLREKLLQTADMYQGDDLSGLSFLRTLHNDLFLEVSRFLRIADAAQRFPELERGKNKSTFTPAELDRQQLLIRALEALRDAKRAEGEVHKFVQQNGLVNIGEINLGDIKLNVELALTKARRAITSIVIELKSNLIDIDWLGEFTRFVSECAEAIGRAVQKMDASVRDSSMVKAILSFVRTTVSLTQEFRSLLQGFVRKPGNLGSERTEARADPAKMGVEIGQKYRDSFSVWQVDALMLTTPKEGLTGRLEDV